jgi:hypothetical protein
VKKDMNKMILVAMMSVIGGTSTIRAERGFFDALVSAAGYVYEAGYTTYAAQVQTLLHDLVSQTWLFGRSFGPIHDAQLIEIGYMVDIIDREWPFFLSDHEYVFGLRAGDLIYLRNSLDEMLSAMRHARISPRLIYDYELSVVMRALDGVVHEVRQSVVYLDSIERIANYFNTITTIMHQL